MPINGLIFKGTLCYGLELAASTNQASAYVSCDYVAELSTAYVIDVVNVVTGIDISIQAHAYSTNSTTYVYKGPNAPFGGLVRSTATCDTDGYIHAEFDVEIYGLDNQLLQVQCSAIRVDMNGTVTNLGGFTATSTGLGPAYLPVVGGAYSVSGYVNVGQQAAFGPNDDWTVDGNLNIGGGYRFKEAGSDKWESLPVKLAPIANVASSGPVADWDYYNGNTGAPPAHWTYTTGSATFGLDARIPAVASDTWGTQLTSFGHWEHVSDQYGYGLGPNATASGHEVDNQHFASGSLVVFPNPPKGWRYFDPAAERNLLLGWRLPQVTMQAQRGWRSLHSSSTYSDPSSITGHETSSVGDVPEAVLRYLAVLWQYRPLWMQRAQTVYNARAGEVGSLNGSGSRLDDCFNTPTYAIPYGYHAKTETQSDWSTPAPGDLTASGSLKFEACQITGFDCEDPSDGTPVWNMPLYHLDGFMRYMQSGWVHPHWNISSLYEDWSLYGSPVNREDYWKPGGIQYYANSSLPAAQITHTRSDDCITPLGGDSAYQPWIDYYYGFKRPEDDSDNPVTTGTGFDWIGLGAVWHSHQTDILKSYTYDEHSAPLWSVPNTDSTLGVYADALHVTVPGAQTTIDLQIGSFDYAPYMWPHLAHIVALNWPDNQGFDISVSAVGLDGTEAVIATSKGTFDIPTPKSQKKYAGSWSVFDGTDSKPQGISPIVFFDPELCTASGLLTGHNFKVLRFRLTRQQGTKTNNVVINYPTLKFNGYYTPVWEDRQVCDLVFTVTNTLGQKVSGPVLRYGALLYFDPLFGFMNPPVPEGLGFKTSMVDCLCWLNHWLLGKDMLDQMGHNLSTINTFYEGQSVSQSDRNSMAWPMPMTEGKPAPFAMVNTCRSLPVLTYLPPKAPDSKTWIQTGARDAGIWVWSNEPRQIVSNGDYVTITTSDDHTTISTPNRRIGNDWYVTWQKAALTNSEGVDYRLKYGDKLAEYAKVSPWYGYFAVLTGLTSKQPGTISYDVSKHKRHAKAWIDPSSSKIKLVCHANNVNPLTPVSATNLEAQTLCVRWTKDNSEQLGIVYVDSNNHVLSLYTKDEGKTFTMPTTLGTGYVPAMVFSDHKTKYIYWITDDGSGGFKIVGQIRSQTDQIVSSTFDAIAGVDNEGLAVDESIGQNGQHVITLLYSKSGSITTSQAKDGKHFS